MGDRLQMDAMTGDEVTAFIAYEHQAYARQRVTYGGEDPRDAEEAAAKSTTAFFPDGAPAEGHSLFIGREVETGERAGVLWLFERKTASGTSVFIYDVEVEQDRRAKGWGRELMAYAEQWAGQRGAFEIALNVFGGNTVARGLYSSLGYSERSVAMAKPLKTRMPLKSGTP